MNTELIELQDGLFIEVQSDPDDDPKQIVANPGEKVKGAMKSVRELLVTAVEPVVSVWDELNQDAVIEQVEIELGIGFEASGQLFIVNGTGTANVRFKLTVRPKTGDDGK